MAMKGEWTQLEHDTAAYFEQMTEDEARRERALEAALGKCPRPDPDTPDE
jgi:hypothetical protein